MYTTKLKPIPNGSGIPATYKKKLKKHKAHHSDKHSKSMGMSMLKGSTFEDAHEKAMELKPIPNGSSRPATYKKKLEKHRANHSDKHLKSMEMSMRKGST